MQLQKRKNLVLSDGTEFPLITSIVFYNAAWFERHLRWKVQDDTSFLKPLVRNLLEKSALTESDISTLFFYEKFLSEIKSPETKEGKQAYNASQKDIMSAKALMRVNNPKANTLADENFPTKTKGNS